MARGWHADGRHIPADAKRPGAGAGLCCWFGVEPPAGIEPATPSLPSMRGRFTPPFRTSRPHTSAQVGVAADGPVVGRTEVRRSAVSAKFLGRQSSTGLCSFTHHLNLATGTRVDRLRGAELVLGDDTEPRLHLPAEGQVS